ncbi:MAG: thermonuclease family protein [Brevinematales bacterium]|nr:thermonuclease family protein [Brevinematales bacterium]
MKIFIMVFFLFSSPPLWGEWVSQNAVVREIVDGDTIKVTLSQGEIITVRLLYIDCFETSRNVHRASDIKKLRAAGYAVSEKSLLEKGLEAKRWLLKRLRVGTPLKLEWDNTKPYDRYKRLLALVYTLSPQNCINEELILLGLARPYFVGKTPDNHKKRIENAYHQAILTGKWQWLESKRR